MTRDATMPRLLLRAMGQAWLAALIPIAVVVLL